MRLRSFSLRHFLNRGAAALALQSACLLLVFSVCALGQDITPKADPRTMIHNEVPPPESQDNSAVVTDARGESLTGRRLLGSGGDFQMSVVASANRELHEQVLSAIDDGIARLRAPGPGPRAVS